MWDVCQLDGDIVSACSDGAVRIWTQSTERMLPAEEREKYNQSIADRKQSTKAGSAQDNVRAPLFFHLLFEARPELFLLINIPVVAVPAFMDVAGCGQRRGLARGHSTALNGRPD